MTKIDLRSMSLEELKEQFELKGYPTYRAMQVYQWAQRGVVSFDEMSNLSKLSRQELAVQYELFSAKIEKRLVSSVDGTIKYLFRLHDGEFVEAVLMKYKHGYSICISSQVGCKMGCGFCATGMGGFVRNLTPSEMLSQIQTANSKEGIRISNVVLMGMGEPLDNYENILKFLKLVTDEKGVHIGQRHISLSTCGLVDRIYQLAEEKLQITLSVSLHAPNDDIRRKTMPVSGKWGIEELLKACRYYIDQTGRRISFEYAMIDGVNDSVNCAQELARRLAGMLCHVNLIPVNKVDGCYYQKSDRKRLERFSQILMKKGLTVTIRRTLGSDINASCGQLRRNHA